MKSFNFNENEVKLPLEINEKVYYADISAQAHIKYSALLDEASKILGQVLAPKLKADESDDEHTIPNNENMHELLMTITDGIVATNDDIFAIFFSKEDREEINSKTLPTKVYEGLIEYIIAKLFESDMNEGSDEGKPQENSITE
ncbi:hypothetical protein V9L53_002905 [Listeria monocytogenes]|nr:hypothetical protein [Listeria monocytogenes]EAH4042551.1 hypothetical protein [Listeria monocytogenes]EAH4061135.1 hypothetical protein [Listeria monocytogenes]EDO1257440.1 hypothetical protein [Listeria monocytogenes]EGA6105657.1 hypothetical protein [Listeria monocytogenes]